MNIIKQRYRLLLFAVAMIIIGVLFIRTTDVSAADAKRPNIIFILTDDLGWGDPACFGHPVMKTPAIDRIAADGTIFRQFYVNNPVCSPSRTAFMTGHYPARHLVHGHFARHQQNADRGMPDWLDPNVTTVTDLLRQAGYATAHFGKWHLSTGLPGVENIPLPGEYGIDDSRVATGPGPKYDEAKNDPYFRAHSTDLFVDQTLRFIRENRDRPFYVNLWTLVPHALLKPTPEELAVYDDLVADPKLFEGWMRDYAADAPDLQSQLKTFCAAVTGMDRAIGRLLDELDKMGLADNTLIFFTSDNGPEDYHVSNAKNAGLGSAGPLRARKRGIYEGGVRTSCIVRWPGHIPAGRVDEDSVITAVDFLPTVCRLAGVEPTDDLALDGEDISDILLDQSRERTRPIFWEWRFKVAGNQDYLAPGLAVRDGRWKYFTDPEGQRRELYDITKDPSERNNVIADHPDVVQRLHPMLLEWKATLPK